MATDYRYRAIRKLDGVEIHSGTVTDILGQGMRTMHITIRSALIHSDKMAKGLTHDDIEIEMSQV